MAFAVVGEARAQSSPGAGRRRPSPAEVAAPAPPRAEKKRDTMRPAVSFANLSTSDGLPQSHVTAIAQDRIGFMWFGTQEGLARYDGTGFRVYQHRVEGVSDLPSSYVTALAIDANGILWIGTDSGLTTYDVTKDAFRPQADGEAAPTAGGQPAGEEAPSGDDRSITALYALDRHVWVGHASGRIERIEIDTRAAEAFGADAGIKESISSFARDKDGSMWVGTAGEGLFQLKPTGQVAARFHAGAEPADSFGADIVQALLVSKSGSLWIGTEERGLARRMPDGTFQYLTGGPGSGRLTDSRITSLFQDRSGALWVGTRNGLNRLDEASGQIDRFEPDTRNEASLSFSWVTSISQDRGGVLWVGTFAGGLDRFDELAMHFPLIYTGSGATAFLEGKDGLLWIGTYPGALISVDRQTGAAEVRERLRTATGEEIDLVPHWVTELYQDERATIWLSVIGLGLVAFDPATEIARLYSSAPDQLGAPGAWQVARGASGEFWLATWGNGLVRFDPRTGVFTSYVEGFDLPTNLLYAVHIDRRDPRVLWIGTANAGLVRFDTGTENVEIYRHDPARPDSISHDDILSIEQTADGTLWVGTYGGGFNRFDASTKRFERFAENVGLTSKTIYGILADQRGRLWLSTNGGGLVAFDPATRTSTVLDARDGALSEFAQGSFDRGASGRLYFGGPRSAISFRPEEIQFDTSPPPVVLTSLQIYDEEVRGDRPVWFLPPLDLDYNETLLSFRFAGLSYASPQRIRYQYRLLGLSDRWVDLRAPAVTVSAPTSGDYRLEVRAAGRHGTWGKEALSLSMTVAPPPWQTWWAYGLYAVAVALIVFAFVRFQTRRVERIQQATRLEAVERDLELTGAVQSGFLPQDNQIVSGGLQLHGYYRPASTCSGDWWWYELTSYGTHILLVGDVTGHGPGPAMVTAAVASTFRAQQRIADRIPLQDRLAVLNEEVLTVGRGAYQMALTAVEIDGIGGRLSAFGAGGLPAILMTNGASGVVVCRGTPLGSARFEVGRAERPLTTDSRLFLCTDGVLEVELKNGRQYGMRRLIQALELTRTADLGSVISHISGEATAANGTQTQKDDWTFAVADWRPR